MCAGDMFLEQRQKDPRGLKPKTLRLLRCQGPRRARFSIKARERTFPLAHTRGCDSKRRTGSHPPVSKYDLFLRHSAALAHTIPPSVQDRACQVGSAHRALRCLSASFSRHRSSDTLLESSLTRRSDLMGGVEGKLIDRGLYPAIRSGGGFPGRSRDRIRAFHVACGWS